MPSWNDYADISANDVGSTESAHAEPPQLTGETHAKDSIEIQDTDETDSVIYFLPSESEDTSIDALPLSASPYSPLHSPRSSLGVNSGPMSHDTANSTQQTLYLLLALLPEG